MSTTASPIRRLMKLSRPVTWRLILAGFLGAMAIGCSVALLATSAWLISRASEQPPILYLSIAVVGVRAFGVGRSVFRYAERLVSHDAAFRTLTDLRVSIYERLAANGPVALRPYRRGDLLSRSVSDVDSVQDLSLRVLVPVMSGLVVALASVGLAAFLLPSAAVILAIALLVGGLAVPWLTMKAGSLAARSKAPVQGVLGAQVVDLLAGSADVVASGATQRMVAQALETDQELTELDRRSASAAGIAAALGALAQGLAVVGAVIVAVPAVRAGDLAGVNLAVVIMLPLAAYEAVVNLPAAALALMRVRASAERIFELTDAPAAVSEPADPAPLAPAAKNSSTVVVHNLSARYPQAEADAVSEVSLRLEPGTTTALVGPSGSGKSTVAAVLERFLSYQGSSKLNGQELDSLKGDELRTVIGSSGQDDHIFDTSIGENLRLARRDADEDLIWQALALAKLDDWVRGLPLQLDTPVGAHGASLSGGQRQRLALARALLADFDVLILDEPTEHLDPDTAAQLMADVREATRSKATLLITHNEEDARNADVIVTLRP